MYNTAQPARPRHMSEPGLFARSYAEQAQLPQPQPAQPAQPLSDPLRQPAGQTLGAVQSPPPARPLVPAQAQFQAHAQRDAPLEALAPAQLQTLSQNPTQPAAQSQPLPQTLTAQPPQPLPQAQSRRQSQTLLQPQAQPQTNAYAPPQTLAQALAQPPAQLQTHSQLQSQTQTQTQTQPQTQGPAPGQAPGQAPSSQLPQPLLLLKQQQQQQQQQQFLGLRGAALQKAPLQDISSTQELDELERAEATPRSYDPQSPRQKPTRRPLSILSSSSLNSDLSPPARSPDPNSPNRHRRYHSVMVDSRYYHYSQNNPFQCPHTPYAQQQQQLPSQAQQQQPPHYVLSQQGLAPAPYAGQLFAAGSCAAPAPPPLRAQSPTFGSPPLGQHAFFTHSRHASHANLLATCTEPPPLSVQTSAMSPPRGLGLNSPLLSPPSEFPGSLAAPGFQDMFEQLAFKERRVLETRQEWELARDDLDGFRRQVNEMLAAESEPLKLPVRPTVIARHSLPNVGIHTLQCVPLRESTPVRRARRPRVARWRVDHAAPSLAQPANLDDLAPESDADCAPRGVDDEADRKGVALTVVKCLLGFVRCVVSMLPIYQGQIAYQSRSPLLPEYPLPMDTLFGHLS